MSNVFDGRYKILKHLNGQFFLAHDQRQSKQVIIKIYDFEKIEDLKKAYREIKILKFVAHDNVSQLLDLIAKPKAVYLVTTYMGNNLASIIKQSTLSNDNIKRITYQLLRGLKYLHSCKIIHRGLKPQNLELNDEFDLKITDFASARAINDHMTGYLDAKYKAPELLLLERDDNYFIDYNEKIDIWAAGCILAEMYKREALFKNVQHRQMHLRFILELTGRPSDECLERFGTEYMNYFNENENIFQYISFREYFHFIEDDQAVGLLQKMLKFDPQERITYNEALNSPFFQGYHDENDEPTGETPFVDDFSNQDHELAEWKQEVLNEIRTFRLAQQQ